MDKRKTPLKGPVIVAVPVLDEVAHLPPLVAFLAAEQQTRAFPVLLLDGGSRDGSRALARHLAARHPWLHLLDNPDRLQAAALNRAARWAMDQGPHACLIRMDAHARYPKGFVHGLARSLAKTGADSIVVPLLATAPPGAPPWQQALAEVQGRWIGHGGATHRISPVSEPSSPHLVPHPVSHGHHAAFRLARFCALGGYDPRFRANEDAEYDLRLTRAGGRILLDPRWPVAYLPRRAPAALAWQMWRNGIWRGRFVRRHRTRPALRQMLPLMVTLLALATPPAMLWAGPAAALPLLGYGAVVLAATRGMAHPLRGALLAVLSHLGFGAGLALGLLTPVTRPRHPLIAPLTAPLTEAQA